ncbi:MAG: hypothetical protein H7833_01410 [Magnetococcus sp. DMHC-1]|nr:hypothetical protein [Magnetococcales bacterium]
MKPLKPMHHTFISSLFLACWMPVLAGAYCIENTTSVPLHIQSLDSGVFTADAAPGGQTCCQEAECIGNKRPDTLVLIVTGYVPVGQVKPGWHAECRIRLQSGSRVQVRGNKERIECERQEP